MAKGDKGRSLQRQLKTCVKCGEATTRLVEHDNAKHAKERRIRPGERDRTAKLGGLRLSRSNFKRRV